MNDVQIAASQGVVLDSATRRRCGQFIRRVLRLRELDGWEVSVLFCDDSYMRRLNRKYRGIEGSTDVLSFGQREGRQDASPGPADMGAAPPVLPAGDVVVCVDALRRNAEARGISASEELKRLLIHGILHLEGMEHEDAEATADTGPGPGAPMIVLQEQLVQGLKRGTLF